MGDDPFLSAALVTDDLLVRYEAALAQVRHNATHPSPTPDAARVSRAETVVLAWQPDGALATARVSDTTADVLVANGFVHDERTGGYRLSGDDSAAQARSVRAAGEQLDAKGITVTLQHRTARSAPGVTAAKAAPLPSAPARMR
ncbi:hypothetical protein [Streptomyces sp. NPDC127033]|uniref:hypothetical protein n=1 Tax=Streptomyces sp. NPDC127033 TaxID=3347110 RepID=UPI00364867DC